MSQKVKKFMRAAWAAACQESNKAPKSCVVKNNLFIFKIDGNQEKWESFCKAAGVPSAGGPSDAVQDGTGGNLTCVWTSHADQFFGKGGPIDSALPNYEERAPQVHMSRMVQRAIEMRDVAMIEGPVGTGKGYSYLIPPLAMDKKVVVSTSNKALQMQLMTKDLPFLMQFFPDKKFVLVQGKKNYMCKAKCETLGDVTITDSDLREWYGSTKTGNTEEITFTVDKLDQYTVDDYCTGKKCMRYDDCFYYEAKAQREEADVLVTNHAMLALNYLHPGANILPEPDVIVIDEAHQFPQYARSMMAQEFNFGAIKRAMDLAKKYDVDIPDEARSDFAEAVQAYIGNSPDRQVGVNIPDTFRAGIALAQELWAAADDIWDPADMPNDGTEKRMSIDAGKVRSTGNKVNGFSRFTADGCVRWIENGDNLTLVNTPYDVSTLIGNISGYATIKAQDPTKCSVCHVDIMEENFIYVSSRNQTCCTECIDAFDPLRWDTEEVDVATWLEMPHDTADKKEQKSEPTPIIFTSATIAAPDMSHFMRECGIPEAMQMVAKSPFDYKTNALLYVASTNAPAPNDTQRFREHLVDEITALITAAQGGALVLFTSYANMQYCHEALEYTLMDYKTVLKQGDMPKMELIKRFEQDGNGILFATKSFWEGVSIEDDPLRLVIIDKMPFEAQSPLVNAQAEHLRRWAAEQGVTGSRLEWYPFNHQAIPRMVMDLKQGAGRLIRTQRDRGVIAILDPRIRTKQYGRKSVLPSLPDAKVTDNIHVVQQFFADRAPISKPATSMEVFGLMASEEVPF